MEDKKIYRIMEMRYGDSLCRYGVNVATGEPKEFYTTSFGTSKSIPDIGDYVIFTSNEGVPGKFRNIYVKIDPPFTEEEAPPYVRFNNTEPEPWRPHNIIEALQWLYYNELEPHEVNKYILMLCAIFGGMIGLHYIYSKHYIRAAIMILFTLLGAWVTAEWTAVFCALVFYIWLPTDVDGRTEI